MAGRRAPPPPELDLDIGRIGSAGDGIAAGPGGTAWHVARTLPGEAVRVQPMPADGATRAGLVAVLRASPARVAPPCPHFDQGCGGCALQHWDDTAYAAWKRGLVADALARAGFADPAVGHLRRTPPRARRRMDFAVQRREGGVTFGLHRAHGREIVELEVCHVLHPALFALVAPLRRTLSGLAALRRAGSVLANLTDGGADLLLRTDGPLAPTDRAKLAAFAAAHGVCRVSWAAAGVAEGATPGGVETASMLSAPHMSFGGTRVEAPPGAFLQASAEGEAAIVAAVLAGLPPRGATRPRAVELFAGIGTIGFAVAAQMRVQAYEGDEAAAHAARRAQSGTRLEMTRRDLARQPLSAKEMDGAAVVILDPPYGGAAMQMPAIAASGVRRVIYVSCNPGILARDGAVLAQAGYRLLAATPIDQFLWSAQIECVAVLAR
jgi:23S rRNA (uracil1939-C5)-methyltransferase